jgi:hypothetical protein
MGQFFNFFDLIYLNNNQLIIISYTMAHILMNEWFVNDDKSITFYDKVKHAEFANGKSKQVASNDSKKVVDRKTGKVTYDAVMVTMHEHTVSNFPKPVRSTQITGYEIDYKSVKERRTISLLLPFGRRRMENKKAVQTDDDIEILFGFKEAPVVETSEATPEATEPVTTTEVPAETTSQETPAN